MKAVILLGLLGFALASLDCSTYVCGDLDDGVCATISADGNTITINENGCPDDQYCSVILASAALPSSDDNIYACEDSYDDSEDDGDVDIDWSDFSGDDWKASVLCDSDSDKNLKSGSWDDECDSDDDCELNDGTNASCECHVNGKSYCTPDLESDYFEEWHTLCEDGDANEVYYTYFATKANWYTLFEHIESDFDCATDVAEEYKEWDDIESDYEDEDAASSMVLGSLLALLLLA